MSVMLVGSAETRMSNSNEDLILSRVGVLDAPCHDLSILGAFEDDGIRHSGII